MDHLPEVMKVIVDGGLGAVGGITRFFFDIDKGKRRFSVVGFLSTTLLASIAGVAVGEMMPDGYHYYGLTMIAGFYGDYVVSKIGERLGR